MAELPDYVTAAGRRRLADLLPAARAEARKASADGEHMRAGNSLGESSLSFIREENLEALVIHRTDLGGWHADILLRNVPPGFPNAMGSPVTTPLRNKAEAEQYGYHMLVGVLATVERNKAAPPARPTPSFLFHRYSLQVDPTHMVFAQEGLASCVERGSDGSGVLAYALAELERLTASMGEVTGEKIDALDRRDQAGLSSAICVAVLRGIFAYPLREDAPPPDPATAAAPEPEPQVDGRGRQPYSNGAGHADITRDK